MIPPATEIVSFRPAFAADFDRLNREWLEQGFTIEPLDEEYLGDPQGWIIDRGGEVFFALQGDAVVGTCAAIPQDGDGEFELAKLCVTPTAQGGGIGRMLCRAVLDFVRGRGANRLFLVSSSKLGPALRLYETLGFKHRAFPGPPPYTDADVYMELDLVDG